eukprot:TRINITY_DN4068_c0_g1_i4.p1 TRINITY_DN4068_c0_g1~~TRINITY_DN4068_c0_g1_i4.p1  ORF type:complete len:602 (+),score=116.28 TRINITY_DN4068_c0_g1_i4:59-1864(+)
MAEKFGLKVPNKVLEDPVKNIPKEVSDRSMSEEDRFEYINGVGRRLLAVLDAANRSAIYQEGINTPEGRKFIATIISNLEKLVLHVYKHHWTDFWQIRDQSTYLYIKDLSPKLGDMEDIFMALLGNPNLAGMIKAQRKLEKIFGKATEHPGGNSSPLAQFSPCYIHGELDCMIDPQVSAIAAARCEIQERHGYFVGQQFAMSPKNNVIWVTGATGYKDRDPSFEALNATTGEPARQYYRLSARLWGYTKHMLIDESRSLLWASGDSRIRALDTTLTLEDGSISEDFGGIKFTAFAEKDVDSFIVHADRLIARSNKGNSWKIWDISKMTPHGRYWSYDDAEEAKKAGVALWDDSKNSCRDLVDDDDYDAVEMTKGDSHHLVVDVKNADMVAATSSPDRSCWISLHDPNLSVWAEEKCLPIADMQTATVVRCFAGHTCEVRSIDIADSMSDVFLTASEDHTAKIWDYRTKMGCTITLHGAGAKLTAARFASVGGVPFVFAGGLNESIRCWDLRYNKSLYKLSTGNNWVHDLVWHGESQTLYAATENYNQSMMGLHGYTTGGVDDDDDDKAAKKAYVLRGGSRWRPYGHPTPTRVGRRVSQRVS